MKLLSYDPEEAELAPAALREWLPATHRAAASG